MMAFKYKKRNIMSSLSVWLYVFSITALAFFYSFQKDEIQSSIKQHSSSITLFFIVLFILCLIQSQFIYIKTKFKDTDYNKDYTYNDLVLFKDIVPIVAILGLSRVGKTTLVDSMFYEKTKNQRTQKITGRLKNIEDNKNALIYDMSGENNIQINDVLQFADCIIFLLDHNESNCESIVDKNRIEANIKLINNLCTSYNEKWRSRNVPTLFLINKIDLSRGINLFELYYKKEIDKWMLVFGDKVKCMEYSNKYISESMVCDVNISYELKDIMKFIKESVCEK